MKAFVILMVLSTGAEAMDGGNQDHVAFAAKWKRDIIAAEYMADKCITHKNKGTTFEQMAQLDELKRYFLDLEVDAYGVVSLATAKQAAAEAYGDALVNVKAGQTISVTSCLESLYNTKANFTKERTELETKKGGAK